MISNKIISEIQQEYLKDSRPWIIGYSGGKDSSTVIKLVYLAMKQLNNFHKNITVIYCDTNIENPIINDYARKTLINLEAECQRNNIPIKTKILVPDIENSFFVKIIGKGYPTPTNKFRWCTNRLRINPINTFINKENKKQPVTVLLGVRKHESQERNKTISKNLITEYYLKQSGNKNVTIYSPIINFYLSDIWDVLLSNKEPFSIDGKALLGIYNNASSRFQEVKNGLKYGDARFGCWLCTVVRKDKSVINLIKSGHEELTPFLKFRDWILTIRDNPKYRNTKKYKNKEILGSFNIEARKLILNKLQKLEKETKTQILSKQELKKIKEYWKEEFY